MPVFHSEHWVKVELARVFSFFSDPQNLPRLMPAASDARIERLTIVSPSEKSFGDLADADRQVVAGPGSEVEISFRLVRLLPLRAKWLARILEFQQNVYFTDTQVEGPFQKWHHRHEFIPEERAGQVGTIIRDCVEYEVGYGIFGRLARVMVKAQIARTFRERQHHTERLLALHHR
jgi:ligand-binding SRPBCC domain-containing protein